MTKTNILTMSDTEFEFWCSAMGMAPLPSAHILENLLALYCQVLGAGATDERAQCLHKLANVWRMMADDTISNPLLDSTIPALPWCAPQDWRQ